jgi:hypothetical protein
MDGSRRSWLSPEFVRGKTTSLKSYRKWIRQAKRFVLAQATMGETRLR